MDPNGNLEEQRRLADVIRDAAGAGPMSRAEVDAFIERAARLAELVEAMDEWLSRQGFLPASWAVGRKTP